ncbi:MAG: hypothetical protein CMK44_03055 [Porticoccus sp.]|nr:hypothetical protein [Porticoccus sp.]
MRKKLYFSRFIKCFILINMIGSFPYLSAQESDDIKKSTPIKKQDANKITQPQKDVLLKEQNRILTKEEILNLKLKMMFCKVNMISF